MRLLTGLQERKFFNNYFLIQRKGEILSGNVANKGYARGRVKLIHVNGLKQLRKDSEKFVQGDILVTTMTQVNVVPLMKKSSAILTEQGGITSHAAIISRELNKPCIIGIRNLMLSLKDGDVVEVDAQRGIVRKIK